MNRNDWLFTQFFSQLTIIQKTVLEIGTNWINKFKLCKMWVFVIHALLRICLMLLQNRTSVEWSINRQYFLVCMIFLYIFDSLALTFFFTVANMTTFSLFFIENCQFQFYSMAANASLLKWTQWLNINAYKRLIFELMEFHSVNRFCCGTSHSHCIKQLAHQIVDLFAVKF